MKRILEKFRPDKITVRVAYLMLFTVLFLSVGYSAFVSDLSIGGVVTEVRIQKDVRISGLSVDNNVQSAGVSRNTEYDVENILSTITLPDSDSVVKYNVEIMNLGNVEVGILKIDNLPSNLDYEFVNYNEKDKICNSNNECKLGIIKQIGIIIKYREGYYNSSNTIFDINIHLDFRQFYNVTDTDIIGSYQSEVIEGDTLEVDFGANAPQYVQITMNDIELTQDTDYTYTNGIVNIPNVDGDIEIEEYIPPVLYVDSTLNGSDPKLFDGTLTPVIYDGDNWRVANIYSQWYDYENQWWANAVILRSGVTKNVGDIVTVDITSTADDQEALAMFVWVPRYEYKISDAAATNANKGEIHVNFIPSTQTTPSTSEYAINSGFTFGSTNLSGIWVGKFEASSIRGGLTSLGCTTETCTTADDLRVLPNVQSLRSNKISNFFFATRSMSRIGNTFGINSTLIDTHMMKNSEWGIAAYLSQSTYGKYGNSSYTTTADKEVYINNSSLYYTGRSLGAPGSSNTTSSNGAYRYNVEKYGTGASTTGNIYGIYDMSGGAYEYVMGVFANSSYQSGLKEYLWSGNSATENSGFNGKYGSSAGTYSSGVDFPNEKYYDVYKASSGVTMTQNRACNGGICYGHAVSPEVASWYSDTSYFVSADRPWFNRGGTATGGSTAGIMYRTYDTGYSYGGRSFRIVFSEP